MTMITLITSLFFGFGYDELEAFNPNNYLILTIDSSKVVDSISVGLLETEEYSRDDFDLLLEKFCTDKPISPDELIENRSVLK